MPDLRGRVSGRFFFQSEPVQSEGRGTGSVGHGLVAGGRVFGARGSAAGRGGGSGRGWGFSSDMPLQGVHSRRDDIIENYGAACLAERRSTRNHNFNYVHSAFFDPVASRAVRQMRARIVTGEKKDRE